MVHEVEDFYGVYLLYCLNPRYKGRTYIGYTVDPNRRIKQHNTGRHAGGAYRTSGRGPWEMVLIIHGFPNDVSGLRFEWAWQNPDKSRRLKGVSGKSSKESAFQYRWRVVCNMLRTAPWSGLSLTVRWLKQDYQQEFPAGLEPPLHMPVDFGPVLSKKIKSTSSKKKEAGGRLVSSQGSAPPSSQAIYCQPSQSVDSSQRHQEHTECDVCHRLIQQPEDRTLSCLLPNCPMSAHIICLAQHFLTDRSKLLPVEGRCPLCQTNLLWGELVRYQRGCNRHLRQSICEMQAENDVEEDHLSVIESGDSS